MEKCFQVNTLGAMRITESLLKCLKENSKIIIITSRMGSIHDNTSGGRYSYRCSKAALNMFGKSLAVDLLSKKIAVGILHPGHVVTDMTNNSGLITPEESVSGLEKVISNLTLENSGQFFHSNGTVLPW
eukprot:GHVL01016688.1.p1 GENE.GHVL01016688.1~~GHVL01016688.1.p1  ORF type:complete len:129 (+),score=23.97 GHVL01016688.1:285-671(+)